MSEVIKNLNQVVDRYAKAIFQLAKEQDSVEDLKSTMEILQKIFTASPEFLHAITSPVVAKNTKTNIINDVWNKYKLHKLMLNFCSLLINNNRIEHIEKIIERFYLLISQDRGEIIAEVITAFPLQEGQLSDITTTIKNKYGKPVSLKLKTDPRILGGIIITIGSKMLDNSIANKLAKIKALTKNAITVV